MIRKHALSGCLSLVVAVLAPAALPAGDASPVPPSAPQSTASPNSLLSGDWGLSGNLEDLRLSGGQIRVTNRFTLDGHYDHERFLVNLTPQGSEDNVAESAGWDGELFYLIAHYPNYSAADAGKALRDLPRTESLGKVEPTVFSRYATPGLASVLLAFAGTNALERLQSGNDIFILNGQRRYPEENNTFKVKRGPSSLDLEAICHGGEERGPAGFVPIQGFAAGFTRWTYHADLNLRDPSNGVISVRYRRFHPSKGKLLLETQVTGQIQLRPDRNPVSVFRPAITESSLLVDDYGCRPMLFPHNKGIVDQCCIYPLTNHVWDFDRRAIATHFVAIREMLARPDSLDPKLQDEPLRKFRPPSSRPVAPDFTVKTLSAETVQLANLRGKYVLLAFWSTTCAPCIGEIPALKETYDAFGKDGRLAMLSLALDDQPEKVEALIKKHQMPWPQALLTRKFADPVAQSYHVSVIPSVILISPDGKILDYLAGGIKSSVAAWLQKP